MKFPYTMLLDFVRTDLDANRVGDLLTMAGFEVEGIEDVEGEPVIDVKVMSNRGDALSVYGLSREVLAKDAKSEPTDLYRRAAARFSDPPSGTIELPESVATIESQECNRFACRAFENVPGEASAPEWIQARVRRAGMRPISLLVDLTNYVMLELGQPLHAFDRDKLRGGKIVVRYARPSERLTTLNGQEHELAGQMMICDGERPVGVPGVMGGLETEVTPETKHLLLESANFENNTVRRTRKQLGLSTEASYRFERSVDPDGVVAAISRFTELLAQAVPQATFSNVVDHYPRPPESRSVRLRVNRASLLLGMPISLTQASTYLGRLGFQPQMSEIGDRCDVAVPSWRPDVVREEDLVEELGRVHGYEKIPERLPSGTTTQGGASGIYFAFDCLREAAVRTGFVQTISHSLRDLHPLDDPSHHLEDRLGPRVIASPEHAYLRDSLLPSLADAAQRNGGRNLHLFEMGKIFARAGAASPHAVNAPAANIDCGRLRPLSSSELARAPESAPGPDGPNMENETMGSPDARAGTTALDDTAKYLERRHIAFLSTGELIPNERKIVAVPEADFFALRGALDRMFGSVGLDVNPAPPDKNDPRFHPTRQAAIRAGAQIHGIAGQIHPDLADQLNLPAETYLAELDINDGLLDGRNELAYHKVSRNPAVRRDVAVLIDKSIPYKAVAEVIARTCQDVLERQWLFDVFEGAGIPEGKHSLGIALQLRKAGENFTDEEANQVRDRVAEALVELGATMR